MVTVELAGFRTSRQADVLVRAGQTASLALRLAVGDVAETVVVTAAPPNDPDSPGNPASKSGLNYSDIGGEAGVSRDNFYYIDGINVTDGVSCTFGANLNTEIIQEQQVLTGGIPGAGRLHLRRRHHRQHEL